MCTAILRLLDQIVTDIGLHQRAQSSLLNQSHLQDHFSIITLIFSTTLDWVANIWVCLNAKLFKVSNTKLRKDLMRCFQSVVVLGFRLTDY